MSLPIDSVRELTANKLAVYLTLILGPNIEVKQYPECYAIRVGNEVYVFSYQDGPAAHPRARWAGNLVLGVEHFGNHPDFEQWHDAHTPPAKRARTPKPPAGPEYPQAGFHDITKPKLPPITGGQPVTVMPLETSPEEIEAKKEALLRGTGDFPTDDAGSPPGDPSTPESEEASTTPPESPEETTAWMAPVPADPAQDEEEWDGWKPKGRPTPHREVRDVQQSTLKRSRGSARKATKTVGTALLLGFALLGFTPR